MAATTRVITQWRCLEPGCHEAGEGPTAAAADKASEKHGKAATHATVCWSEPPLPVKVPAARRGG